MGTLKALIYRELYISRKYYITGILTALLFSVMGILVRLSMLYGNLANLDEEAFELVDTITYYGLTYMISYAAFNLVDNTDVILSDFRSNWRMFSFTLPVTPVKNILAKYIIKLGAFCFAMVLSTANGAIIGAFSGREFGALQILNFFIFANFWLLVDLFRGPIMLASGTEKGFQMAHWGFIIPMAAIMLPLMSKVTTTMAEIAAESEAEALSPDQQMFLVQEKMIGSLEELHDKIVVWMPLLTVVLFVLGFLICVQCLKRREK